jgi:hypothetical protein
MSLTTEDKTWLIRLAMTIVRQLGFMLAPQRYSENRMKIEEGFISLLEEQK